MKLEAGQRALVTGGSRGLGLEIARALAKRGLHVVLAARSADDLDRAAGEVRAHGAPYVDVIACDLVDPQACELLARRGGPVDVLVNNAGVERPLAYPDRPSAEIAHDIALNLAAPMLLTKALLPEMIARGQGHVLNVASAAGLLAMPWQEPYCATKAGLIGFSRALRLTSRAAGWGVGVSALCPGFIGGDGMFERIRQTLDLPIEALGVARLEAVGIAALAAIEQDLAIATVDDESLAAIAAEAILQPEAVDAQLLASPAVALFAKLARFDEQGGAGGYPKVRQQ